MTNRSRAFRFVPIPVLACAVWLAVPSDASADRWYRPRAERAAAGALVSVEVQVDGDWVSLHRAPGVWDRQYFQAERGARYALRIRNRTSRRVGVLVSVDGLNVVNGERSRLAPQEPMYVLDPWETATIRGWRTSLEHVREFVFVDEKRSYANRTGQANGDMGWVRVLAFEERRPVALRRPAAPDEGYSGDARGKAGPHAEAAPAPQKGRADDRDSGRELSEEQYPGTGWGDRRRDPVQETWFEPVALARDRIVLRYEYARALAELGIDLRTRNRLEEREYGEWRFAQPPRR